MPLERSFRISSLLMAASGFMALAIAADLPFPLVILGFTTLTICVTHTSGWGFDWFVAPPSNLSTQTWNILMLTAFFGCVVDLIWLTQDLLLAGVNFLIVLMIHKLFNLRQRKDFLYLYAISFLLLLSAAALTVEPWYAVVFTAFLLSAIWTLLLYHLRNEAEEVKEEDGETPGSTLPAITARFFWTTNGIALTALFITFAIFFVTPRVGTGLFQKQGGQTIRTSGFSETVNLGVIGSVKLDPTIVMRVSFPDLDQPGQDRLYLQGASYNQYDGRSWVNSLNRRQAIGRSPSGEFVLSTQYRSRDPAQGLKYEIITEILDTSRLFGISTIQWVKGNFFLLKADGMGNLHLPYSRPSRFQYTVFSIPRHFSPTMVSAPPLPDPLPITQRFLQLPGYTPRVEELARHVTQHTDSRYAQTTAIQQFLMREYQYSLDVGTTFSTNPVEEFLFNRKTGYCEHYATAMVVLLRTLDIPSRLVTGFLVSEWNDFGSYYTVRQQDAHAWVEVFFPSTGWVIFDPTPPVITDTPTGATATLGRFMDALRLKWTRFIIQYSSQDQQAVLEEVRDRSRPVGALAWQTVTVAMKWIKNWNTWVSAKTETWGWQYPVLSFFLIALIVLLIVRRKNKAVEEQLTILAHATPQQVAATKFYARMLQLLRTRGLDKAPGVGPLEFSGWVSTQSADLDPFVTPLTEWYCRIRFGARHPHADEMKRANHLLTQLQRQVEPRG